MLTAALIIATVTVAAAASGSSLDTNLNRFNIGFTSGVNHASMYGAGIEDMEEEYDVSGRYTANSAFSFEYKPIQALGLELGVCFNGKGFKYEYTRRDENGARYDIEVIMKDGFIEFPLVAKPSISVNKARLYLVGGAAYGRVYKASREVSVSAQYMGMDTTFELPSQDYYSEGEGYPVDTFGTLKYIPYEDLYRLDDFSVVLGAGIESKPLHFGLPTSFLIDLRYSIGLRDHTRLTPEGRERLQKLADEFQRFLEENNQDPEEYFSSDNSASRAPIHKYSTFSVSVGFRMHF